MKNVLLTEDHAPLSSTFPGREPDIRCVLLVGARIDGNTLSANDRRYLRTVFSLCARNDVCVAPDVSVKVCNLEYGDDFLAAGRFADPRADAVVFSYVFYHPPLIGVHRVDPFCRQSSLAGNDGAWHRALENTGAKIAVNVRGEGDAELPTDVLKVAPFRYKTSHFENPGTDPKNLRIYDLLVR